MATISSPLNPKATGASVKDLHNTLLSIAMKLANAEFSALLQDTKFMKKWNDEYKTSTYGEATEQAVKLFQEKQMGIKPTGKINKATATAINNLAGSGVQNVQASAAISRPGNSAKNTSSSSDPDAPLKVYGIVYDEWIEPLKGAPVMIFDKDIRSEQLLGEGEIDEKGNYSITYPKDKLTKQDKAEANIIVRVYGTDGNPLYTSPVNYNAEAQLQVNINLGPRAYMGVSEFAKSVELIRPFIGELPIHDLTENKKVHDLSFLISKTGIAANILLQLVASYRFEKWTGLEAEVYYGILRDNKTFPAPKKGSGNLPSDVDSTIEQAYIKFWGSAIAAMMSALQNAAMKNTVTYTVLKRKESIEATLRKLKTAPPQETGATQSLPPVYTNIATAGLNSDQQQAFLNLYSTNGINSSFWSTLAQDKSFQGATAVINKLQAIYQVANWTANNTALITAIIQNTANPINSPQDISKLVSNSVSDWVIFINNSNTVPAGTTQAATVQKLANSIAAGVEQLYPTPVFADRFSKNTTLQIANQDIISGILKDPNFDITKSIPAYIQKNPLPAGSNTKTITNQVLGMQRTYKVTQTADAALTLLADNIQSARQVYQMGKSNFVTKYSASLGSDTAASMYENAAEIHAGATHLYGQLSSRVNNPQTRIMMDYNSQVPGSKLMSEYPDLANLFGMAASYCECTDCESFLGIPAYLADLLDFLYERQPAPGGSLINARAALLANKYDFSDGTTNAVWHRRPDIGDIDLNCDNTNVELPYIDIVNELLEDYIIPPVACIKVGMPDTKNDILYFIYWLIYYLKPGQINPFLCKQIVDRIEADKKTPICNISLLTDKAIVSDMFFTDGADLASWIGPPIGNVPGSGPQYAQWIIRDQFITLKVNLVYGANIRDEKILPECDCPVIDFPLDFENLQKDSGVSKASEAYFNRLGTTDGYSFASSGDGDSKYFELIIQEVHQTHLTTAEINANPEYTNTNVYNSLSDPFNTYNNNKWDLYNVPGGMIPVSLPFDLYFTEANTYLQKMGIQRCNLMDTFRKEGGSSLDSMVIAYMGLSTGDEAIIFTPMYTPGVNAGQGTDPQIQFWGSQLLDGTGNVEVSLFLAESGLTFQQLQTLLTVTFINPPGLSTTSYIADTGTTVKMPDGEQTVVYDPCNIATMFITNVTSGKMDCINRFLRLWNKLNAVTTISMHELDLCIMCHSIGKENLDIPFAENMYYFLQLMSQMSLTATQNIVFYENIDTSVNIYDSTFVNLYQQLFQNRQISNPLVPAFTLPLQPDSLITDTTAVSVILTACGIMQADMTTILNYNSPTYTQLTLDNLSFIYACGLLSNTLSISVSDIITFITLTKSHPINPVDPVSLKRTDKFSPADTFNFITKFNELQQAGFTIDGLNYLLTNQSTATPSLIPNTTAVLNGLGTIRSAIQTAITAATPVPDPKGVLLKQWLADPDLNWNKNMAAQLISILASSGTATYSAKIQNNLRFLQLLQIQYQESGASAYLPQLPAIQFPDSAISGISFENTNCYLFYSGKMDSDQYNTLANLLPSDPATQTALTELCNQSQECALSAVLWQPSLPATTPVWLNEAQQSVPNFSIGQGVLGFTGVMSGPDYMALLAQSNDSDYGCALTQLFIATHAPGAGSSTYVQLASLPTIELPDLDAASLLYSLNPVTNKPELSFTGAMSTGDALALLGLANLLTAPDAANWKAVVCSLYTSAVAGQTLTVPIKSYPTAWTSLPGSTPDLSGLNGLSFSPGTLSFSDAMTNAQLSSLLVTTTDAVSISYNNAVNLLYNLSQPGGPASVPLEALPTGFTLPAITGLVFSPPALCFNGQMNDYVEAALENLSSDNGWATTIQNLFTGSQSTVAATAIVPPGLVFVPTATDLTTFNLTYTPTSGILAFQGVMSPAVFTLLQTGASTNTIWTTAIATLFQNSQTNNSASATLPALPVGTVFPPSPITTTILANNNLTYTAASGSTPGTLAYNGSPMSYPTLNTLLQGATSSPDWTNYIITLYQNSQAASPSATTTLTLPVLPTGTVFPPVNINLASLSSNNLTFTAASAILGYTGVMSDYILGLFSALPSTPDPVWVTGVNSLYTNAQVSLVTTVQLTMPTGVTIPPDIGITTAAASTPGATLLTIAGPISTAVQQQLTGLSKDPVYRAAIGYLFVQTSAIIPATLPTIKLPLPDNYISTIGYTPGYIQFGGTPNPDCMDEFNLQQLSDEEDYLNAISWIYSAPPLPATSSYVGAALDTLPSIALPPTAAPNMPISWQNGELGFTGRMPPTDLTTLQGLSTDSVYQAALSALSLASQTTLPSETTIITTVPLASLPPITISPLAYDNVNGVLYYTGNTQMTGSMTTTLTNLSLDPYYRAAVNAIAGIVPVNGSYIICAPAPSSSFTGVTLASTSNSITYVNGILGFTGTMSFADYIGLLAQSPDPDYAIAINNLYSGTAAAYFPLPPISIPAIYTNQLSFSSTTSTLTLSGYISSADQSALLSFSSDPLYQQAINALYKAVNNTAQPETEFFSGIYETLWPVKYAELAPPATVDLYAYFLNQISPVYQPIKEAEALETQIASNFSISMAIAAVLVDDLPGLCSSMTETSFACNTKPINPDPNQFPQALWYMKLARMAYIINQFSLAASDTDWLLKNADLVKAIDFTYYPTAASPLSFDSWEVLYNFCTFNRRYKPQTIPDVAKPGNTVSLSVYSIISGVFDLIVGTSGLSYVPATSSTPAALCFKGQMDALTGDSLLSLSNDGGWWQDIKILYQNSQSQLTTSVTPTVPAGTVFPPAGIQFPVYGLSQPTTGTLEYQGVMSSSALKMLLTISTDSFWTTTINSLYTSTQANLSCGVQLPLPSGLTVAQITGAPGVSGITGNTDTTTGLTILSASGPVNAAVQAALTTVSTDSNYQAAIGYLAAQISAIVPTTLPRVLQTPPDNIPFSQGAVAFTGYPNPGMLLAQLVQLTGWTMSELLYLLNITQPTVPNSINNPLWLLDSGTSMGCIVGLWDISILQRLAACFNIAKQMKVVPSRCVTWVVDPITNDMAIDIKQALKSIYPDDESWMSAIQPIANTLRQNRRDALLAYLLSNPVKNVFSYPGTFTVFPDEYHVYGNFLIDIEMSSCQPTTRIIQAYCSVQLFVQRCLMNIEAPSVVANSSIDADWLQWSWMGTFETWYEARYTFLYPENFIMPQTLPNQSSFFEDMQNDMSQGPVTTAIVETAYGNYLQSLDEVARLEVRGMWYDHPNNILHVFGRTYGGDPGVYYYRTLNIMEQWSPWEKVTADIAGDQIIPVVQNGRIYLYWPVFAQTSDDDKSPQQIPGSGGGGSAPPPTKYWKIQMAFSEYRNGQWSGKKISKDNLVSQSIITTPGSPVIYPDTSDFVFIALDIPTINTNIPFNTALLGCMENNNTMVIGCYQYFGINDSVEAFGNGSDNLSLLNSAPNSFLLDPMRGYPTPFDLTTLSQTSTEQYGEEDLMDIAHYWFNPSSSSNPSSFNNNLVTGTTPLTTETGTPLLTPPNNFTYNNLLSLQMGWICACMYLEGDYDVTDYLGALMPFFYQDSSYTFFVKQAFYYNNNYDDYFNMVENFENPSGDPGETNNFYNLNLYMDSGPYYEFYNFYHPFVHQFIKIFAQPNQGIEAILTRSIQLTGDATYGNSTDVQNNLINNSQNNPNNVPFDFNSLYGPASSVINGGSTDVGYPLNQMDFGPSYSLMGQFSSYGQYNWELFFHGVLMSAIQLSQNQQFADADTWFKFIFNPTDTSSYQNPQKYWVTKPFFENMFPGLTIDDLILLYELTPDPSNNQSISYSFWESIKLWRNDPYDPHMLAQLRVTPYMYTTFMKYLNNLIAWANYNYQQYTMESVNIAIQLFMTALECLGTKPVSIPPVVATPTLNYYQMELELDILSLIDGPEGYLSDPVVQFENILPQGSSGSGSITNAQKIMTPGLYFCVPPNPVLLAYWDTIETQLYKIRHCLNMAGQFQPLSPFPNVPGMGNTDGSGVADFGGVLPNYRFSVMIQKATELCNEVKSLGAALLSALEKQDAEGLALLRASQEITVQQNIDAIKQMQIADANFAYQNLLAYQTLVTDKQSYYADLVQVGLLPLENQALAHNQSSLSREDPIIAATMIAGILHAIPQFTFGASGFGGTPVVMAGLGGQQLGAIADCFVQYMTYESHVDDKNASLNTVNAGYLRRAAEWAFQQQLATDELAQIAIQLQSAQEKIDIATQDEQNQQTLIQNAEDIQTFLQNKYTNQQLYSWMVTQISNVYFQSYQLAYSFAKQAEVCYGYELGITGASYINYGYWDSLHKGLLSGEALMSSLKKMETDYYTNNIREYELTRQISLAQLDPAALLQLKSNGTCFINIPEELFDLDYPGHYFRRVKHIAVTIPGVVGPYTPVCLKMTLMNNSVRMVANPTETPNSYPRNRDSTGAPTNDSRFLDNYAAIQYIATSNGVNDNGLFEMNLHDERYLPFERAGAICTLQLEFPSAYPQFDPQTITDLIVHFSYTSRDGGPALQSAATASVQSKLSKAMTAPGLVLMRAFSARRDFPTQWYQFLNPANPADTQQLIMDITQRFPYFTKGLNVKISDVVVLADIPETAVNTPCLYLSGTKLSSAPITLGPDPQFGNMQYSITPCKDKIGMWTIANEPGGNGNPLTNGDINDLNIIFYYSMANNV